MSEGSAPIDVEARRNGRLYLGGLAASLLGNSAMSLVAGIWVKSLTGSSAEAGLVSVAVYAPSLGGPLAGLLADRVSRRSLLIGLNLVSAAVLLVLLAVRGEGEVWLIFVVMAWYGIDQTIEGPAESALFVEILPEETRLRLNGWNLGLQETGRLVAPLLGAGLYAAIGGGGVAAVDAGTFAVAATTTALIRTGPRSTPAERTRWRTDIVAGLDHLRRTPELRRLLIAGAFVIELSGLAVAAQYSLVQSLGEPPSFLGVLSAALGAGSIVASLTSTRLLARLGERRLCLIGTVDFAIGNLLRAIDWLPATVTGSVVLGFALPWVFLAVLSLAQRATPVDLQGRVAAVVTLAVFGLQAPLQAIGSLAVGLVDFRLIYVCSAIAALAGGLCFSVGARGERVRRRMGRGDGPGAEDPRGTGPAGPA